MIDFYNAFISYKHADLDSSIAEHIQNKLEHFHVPHNIAQKLKHKKITRIFRDKDELPATSNLTDTITDALEKAEHLIVICSTNTKQSVWVQREIETFLKTHSRDKILTVLCDGDPYDVIPEILLFTEKELKDEDGVAHKVKVPIEPLSCDYRMGKKQADKEELARLASAILGCSYDELQRRRRQYKIRRAVTIGSVIIAGLAVFGGYMVYANDKINQNYLEAMKNRSIYLANESSRLLKENYRTDALQLALEALPKEGEDDIPVIPKAEHALTEASFAYKLDQNDIVNSWNFKVNSKISMFSVSPNAKFVTVKDLSGHVYCWDRNTKKIVFEKNDGNGINKIFNPDDDSFIYVYANRIEAYSTKDGKKTWSKECGEINKGNTIILAGDKIYYATVGTIVVLSAKDGKDIAEYKLQQWNIGEICVSPSGDKIAYTCPKLGAVNDEGLNLFDVNTGGNIDCILKECDLKSMSFEGDSLVTATSEMLPVQNTDYSSNLIVTKPVPMTITCFDLSLKQKWSSEYKYDIFPTKVGFLYMPVRNEIVSYAGNVVCFYNYETGDLKNKYDLGSTVLDVSDFDGNGQPSIISSNGYYSYTYADRNGVEGLKMHSILPKDLMQVQLNHGIFTYQCNSKDLVLFESAVEDDEWIPISEETAYLGTSGTQTYIFEEDAFVIASSVVRNKDGNEIDILDPEKERTYYCRIISIDPSTEKVLFTEEIEARFDSMNTIMERFEDSVYLKTEKDFYKINIKNGAYEKLDLKDFDDYTKAFTEGGMIFYFGKNEQGNNKLLVKDLKDGSLREFETEISKEKKIDKAYYVEALNKVFFQSDDTILAADLNSKDNKVTALEMPDSWNAENSLFAVKSNDNGSVILFAQKNMIVVTDASFKEKFSINCEGIAPLGLIFHKDGIYLLSNGYLSVYDDKTGELIKRCEISINKDPNEYDLIGMPMDIDFNDKSDEIYVMYNDIKIIMDKKTMTETAHLDNCYGHHKGTDRFYTCKYQEGIGYFKHYSVDDLIKKAKKILNGQPIPPEYKEKYGIE